MKSAARSRSFGKPCRCRATRSVCAFSGERRYKACSVTDGARTTVSISSQISAGKDSIQISPGRDSSQGARRFLQIPMQNALCQVAREDAGKIASK